MIPRFTDKTLAEEADRAAMGDVDLFGITSMEKQKGMVASVRIC